MRTLRALAPAAGSGGQRGVIWANLLFAVGSLIGIWAIIGVLSGAGDSLEAIKRASWDGWR